MQLSFGDYNLPHQGIPPPNPNNEAHAQAQHMLAKMGLGNTDRLVAEALGRAPPSDAYATPSKSHNNAPSHLAFGDYRLPSTVQAEGPEEDHGRTPAGESRRFLLRRYAQGCRCLQNVELLCVVTSWSTFPTLNMSLSTLSYFCITEKVQSDMVNSIDAVVKPLMLKDLRAQCRLRGLSPVSSNQPFVLITSRMTAQPAEPSCLNADEFSILAEV